jgi:predicted O-linked N-acetylglucosamine transferase (SPINDLY family)
LNDLLPPLRAVRVARECPKLVEMGMVKDPVQFADKIRADGIHILVDSSFLSFLSHVSFLSAS